MTAQEINTLGGVCELLGVVVVVWDLLEIARYRGYLARLGARLDAWRARAMVEVRRLLRRPRGSVVVHAGVATAGGIALSASTRGMRGPFAPQPGQSLEDQVAELGLLVNRLREELLAQDQEHRLATEAIRERMERELRAEWERSDSALRAIRGELEGLRETTTGGMHLRIEGVLVLLVGVIFTTWPANVAECLPSWPPFRVAMFFLGAYVFGRLFWALWLRPGEDQTASR